MNPHLLQRSLTIYTNTLNLYQSGFIYPKHLLLCGQDKQYLSDPVRLLTFSINERILLMNVSFFLTNGVTKTLLERKKIYQIFINQ